MQVPAFVFLSFYTLPLSQQARAQNWGWEFYNREITFASNVLTWQKLKDNSVVVRVCVFYFLSSLLISLKESETF